VEGELLELQTYLTDIEKKINERWLLVSGTLFEKTALLNRILSVLALWSLICLWALERKESRWAHYRSDALELKEAFNKNFVHELVDGKRVSTWIDVPQPSDRLKKWLEEFERTKNYGHSE
jgi:succinate dehydrogenase/fumarate reductase flavoprotein subunit